VVESRSILASDARSSSVTFSPATLSSHEATLCVDVAAPFVRKLASTAARTRSCTIRNAPPSSTSNPVAMSSTRAAVRRSSGQALDCDEILDRRFASEYGDRL